jgi:hypothetical protein
LLLLLVQLLLLLELGVRSVFLTLFFLVFVPEVAITSDSQNFGRILRVTLKLNQLVLAGNEDFRVRLDKLSEVAEESMGRFQEVELRVPLLAFSEGL